jgi:hypothetical protein
MLEIVACDMQRRLFGTGVHITCFDIDVKAFRRVMSLSPQCGFGQALLTRFAAVITDRDYSM